MDNKHPLAAFTIKELVNDTDQDIQISITSLGHPTEPVHTELLLYAHTAVDCELSFGRQEHQDYVPPAGYVFTNRKGALPFETIRCVFDRAEDPLLTIPVVHGYRLTTYPHRYYWSLFCNEEKVGTFSSAEHERKNYSLVIGPSCKLEVIEQV